MRSYSGPYFPAFGLNNCEYGHFSRSVTVFSPMEKTYIWFCIRFCKTYPDYLYSCEVCINLVHSYRQGNLMGKHKTYEFQSAYMFLYALISSFLKYPNYSYPVFYKRFLVSERLNPIFFAVLCNASKMKFLLHPQIITSQLICIASKFSSLYMSRTILKNI